jgi:hypothetical protein
MPDEFLKIRSRQGELVDAALLSNKVVEHIAGSYDRVEHTDKTDYHDKWFNLVLFDSQSKIISAKECIQIVHEDGETAKCYHKNRGAKIKLAVDGEVPTSNVNKTMEIKLFHDFG